MREILFKAKKLNGSEWVIGSYVHTFNEDKKCPVVGVMTENHWIVEISGNMILIDKDTICQYTGLTDKNGNKIWENDVVCTPYVDPIFGDMVNDEILDDYTWKVVFVDGGFCVENEDKIINLRSFTNGNHIKAIGNIFDNADLLKGE